MNAAQGISNSYAAPSLPVPPWEKEDSQTCRQSVEVVAALDVGLWSGSTMEGAAHSRAAAPVPCGVFLLCSPALPQLSSQEKPSKET